MDAVIAMRLTEPTKKKDKEESLWDAELYKKCGTTCRQYIDAGLAALNAAIPDFDAATDGVDMLAPVENATEFAKADRNSALHFRHPMTYIEMATLCCFITQILFGGETARTVEAQNEEGQESADMMNAALAWNDSKIGIYTSGAFFVWNAVVYNRGIWFETVQKEYIIERECIKEDDITQPKEPKLNKAGEPVILRGKPVMVYPQRERWRSKRVYTGNIYNHLDVVSPYDFVCDPTVPLCQFQQGRFAGHRILIPWIELERRSKLDPSDDEYVLPHVVKKIKTMKGSQSTTSAPSASPNTSRTYYERNLRGDPVSGIGSATAGGITNVTSEVNKDDGGVVECWAMTIRAKPVTLSLYEDEEAELITFLQTNQADILSVNIRKNKHNEFPYTVAEGFPNSSRQYSTGGALKVKPCQDRMDELNRTHSDAQARMGNILVIDDTMVDPANLMARDKNGLMIFRREKGRGAPSADVVFQIPLKDTTATYPDEMDRWEKTSESVTGAHAFVQGEKSGPDTTLGEFDAVKQMAQGRISDNARKISELALVPQTRRFMLNYQQFAPEQQIVRIIGKGKDFDPEETKTKWITIKKADIQCGFEVIPHDGSLPGADAKIVAAASRAIEAFAANPALASAFDNTIPGSLDPIAMFRDVLKKSGLPVDKYSVTRAQAQQNLQAKQIAAGLPPSQPGQPQATPPVPGAPAPNVPVGSLGSIPSASALPPMESAAPPAPNVTNI